MSYNPFEDPFNMSNPKIDWLTQKEFKDPEAAEDPEEVEEVSGKQDETSLKVKEIINLNESYDKK